MLKIIHGGVTSPKGFKANGLSAGIKKSGKPDLSLIVSDVPAAAAAVFTQSSIKAAPLLVSQNHLRNLRAQVMITNSGNANCFTGKFGFIYAKKTCELFGNLLNISADDVIVASTGIIGKPLPYNKIEQAASRLVDGLSYNGGTKAAKAIMTTDLILKEICVTINLGGKKVTVAACGKGSGMVAPNMATMLGFVTTDANIAPNLLKQALKEANEQSFNRISVDGCMSTNDMVAVLANGLAENKKITTKGKDFKKFQEALNFVCLDLAKKIVIDGEGATKFIEICVHGAKSPKQAKTIGLTIANSPLVKTAAFGSNPNWGRVAAAVGSLGIKKISESNLKIDFSSFDQKEIKINVMLNLGKAKASIYTCDLSYEYVRINGEYN